VVKKTDVAALMLSAHLKTHMGMRRIALLLERAGIKGARGYDLFCASCALGKGCAKARKKHSNTKADRIAEVVFVDTKGPKVTSTEGYKYYLDVLDKHSSFVDPQMLKQRADGGEELVKWVKRTNIRISPEKVSTVRLDRATEYMSNKTTKALEEMGVEILPGVPSAHTHQADVERAHRTLEDLAKPLMIMSSVPEEYWPQAIKQAKLLTSKTTYSRSVLLRGGSKNNQGHHCLQSCGKAQRKESS